MADDPPAEAPAEPGAPEIEPWSVQVQAPLPLPLGPGATTAPCEKPSTLLMLIQSPEQPVVLLALKALFQWVKDGDVDPTPGQTLIDGRGVPLPPGVKEGGSINPESQPEVLTLLRGALGDGGGIPVIIKLLTSEAWCGADFEVQAVCLVILARVAGESVADGRLILRKRNGEPCKADRNGEERCRLKTVELGGLRPMVEHLRSTENDVAGKAAFCVACHALDSPVRLAIHVLGGVKLLLDLVGRDDEVVNNNAALALSQIMQHVEAKDELYNLKGMQVLIAKGLQHDQVDVQENAARAVAYAIEQEGNLKDLRRLDGINILIEMHAALPDTDRVPNDMVRQAASFALSVSAFDSECRTEIRMKEGLRALSICLASENPRVQEESLMALANCAFDIPCKQTIGALGGMKNGIELLGNDELSVVANACVALSRLVFDFMSGVDFIEGEGVPQLYEVLQKYCNSYNKFNEDREKASKDLTDARDANEKQGDKEAIQRAEDALEKLEMPDLRLGRAILEACKSCAEQGNVREKMREEKGDGSFFKNIYMMMKHEDEIVSGMACQALSNCAFDVHGRPMLLEWGAIGDFVKCLTYKDVDTQLSAARAIGNFAIDSHGRKKVRESNAMPPLVLQLQAKDENGKDAIEPRRAAILAIGKCASDRTSAVELCDIGALTQLLSLMDTHWKQLGQVAEDAVDRLLQKSQSAKLWLRGEVDFEDMTADGWFDMGVGRPYTSLKDLQEEKENTNREVLLVNSETDNKLKQLLEQIEADCKELGLTQTVLDLRDQASTNIKIECVKKIAQRISEKMGGGIAYDKYIDFGYATEVQRCKALRRSNVIWIGDLNKGVCRHRAFLFKYICDIKLPYLCRLERAKIERGAHVGHAWNTIKFYGDVDQEGQQKSYTVDLMHEVGTLYDNGTDLYPADENCAKYQRKDIYHFLSL
jgi:HEAT repeat protein